MDKGSHESKSRALLMIAISGMALGVSTGCAADSVDPDTTLGVVGASVVQVEEGGGCVEDCMAFRDAGWAACYDEHFPNNTEINECQGLFDTIYDGCCAECPPLE